MFLLKSFSFPYPVSVRFYADAVSSDDALCSVLCSYIFVVGPLSDVKTILGNHYRQNNIQKIIKAQ